MSIAEAEDVADHGVGGHALGVGEAPLEVRARGREVLVEKVPEHRPEPRAERVERPRQLLPVVSGIANNLTSQNSNDS